VNAYYGVSNAYSEVVYENSPLARVEQQASPGADWQKNGGHTRKMEYFSNDGNVVKRLKATTVWNASAQINDVSIALSQNDSYTTNGYYNANTLFKWVTKDEDGNETQTYTNGNKQNILLRQINKKPNGSIENLDTYYIYDEFGNLAAIMPPKASGSTLTPALLDQLCYQYKYDQYNRVAEKKLPGKGWVYIVYDKQGRAVLVQDANLRSTNNNFTKQGWIFTKYDKLGRIVYTGFFANTATRTAMQTALNNMSANALNNESTSASPFTQNGIDVYYTKNAFPTGSSTILNVNYYDEYPVAAPSQPAQIQNQATLSSAPTAFTSNGLTSVRNTKGLLTASYTKNVENDGWSSAFIWYDTQGRAIGAYNKNHLGGFTSTESILDFSGKTLESYTYHSKKTANTEVTVKDRFIYGPQNALSKHYQQINSNPEELLTEYTYNDLGQVINKKVGNNLQSVDFNYNIRGWLTGINSNDISTLGNKLFAYRIKYNAVEGAEVPNGSYTDLKVKPKYNGDIAEVDWKTAYGANEPLRRYGYVYDGVNRLMAGFFQTETNPYSKEYSEITDYDLNGNISKLTRTGSIVNTVAEVMDDLKYNYDGNHLVSMEETGKGNALSGYPLAQGTGQAITYDGNGNMISHLDKGITNVTYNFLNLSSKVNNTGNISPVNYVYAANGSKVQMIKEAEVTDYLGNFQYTTQNGVLASSVLANEEGYYDFVNNRYVYQYRDQLGNVRISYTKNANNGAIALEENNYYPFGLKHAGYNTGDTSNNKFKYLYNSKELQSNGNLDYGWRQYMPDLGRWNGMDQLAESYHSASPYAYVMNNPVNMFDPDGRLSQAQMDYIWKNSGAGSTSWGFNGDGSPKMIGSSGWNSSIHNAISYISDGGGGSGSFGGGFVGGTGNGSFSKVSYWTGNMSQKSYTMNNQIYGEGEIGVGHTLTIRNDISSSTYEPSFIGDFAEGFNSADKSNMKSGSAWAGYYLSLQATKYEKLFKFTAQISSGLLDKASALKGAKVSSISGKFLGVVGVGFTVLEDYQNNGKIGVGTGVKVAIGLATTFATGAFAPIALGYIIADVSIGLITGTTITDRIAAGVENTIIGQ
ncbi:RHS repeat domain-containing protein, partial [Chryseobacterium sp. SIMBA_029]|uniref:RHS repeat domain-containing protein n=1 Tax=Chryseobacterium sp. SIMBA_029 TaxID=3085772 RepID=UPI00397BA7EF